MTEKENGYESVVPIEMEPRYYTCGLTKRELFAAMAMQGLIAYYSPFNNKSSIKGQSELAVKCADALLAALAGETE